ncbi:hypothetical protein [Sphingomonas flavescens]|uniref:hypothetical protein n=1 Tax=Sphingomonas flavescens TaxID=3132797 RepID=UPI002805D04E|nr:hypothetical protein [Sphingomonas limnosediminicola]
MTDSSVQFELGSLKFSAQGSEVWIAKQLEFVVSKLPELGKVASVPAAAIDEAGQPSKNSAKIVGSLASYIKEKGGETNQVQRFLATADWLRLKGEKNLKTALVSKALQENHQKKLSNPADSLNLNVSKGFCEKAADGFFITPEGLKALGHSE